MIWETKLSEVKYFSTAAHFILFFIKCYVDLMPLFLFQDMPRQNNGNDCGVYVCMYANYASLRKKPEFTPEDIPCIRQRMAWELSHGKLIDLV